MLSLSKTRSTARIYADETDSRNTNNNTRPHVCVCVHEEMNTRYRVKGGKGELAQNVSELIKNTELGFFAGDVLSQSGMMGNVVIVKNLGDEKLRRLFKLIRT